MVKLASVTFKFQTLGGSLVPWECRSLNFSIIVDMGAHTNGLYRRYRFLSLAANLAMSPLDIPMRKHRSNSVTTISRYLYTRRGEMPAWTF